MLLIDTNSNLQSQIFQHIIEICKTKDKVNHKNQFIIVRDSSIEVNFK